eukprot:CAMPEP_0184978018 /NCGR_PEP_ID=MMETSP1098-20130426/8638_1 /TAXON_ID=89044 /ORGANISM="Spumella elongata, Strain CCAP 955/1" /LENGTH=1145 /DNA_ID=CAMNT_0027501109 /DNA_START=64 /DNA_END=3501 /DNA_ORIENTATION=+
MSRRHFGRHHDKLTKWGDSRANFKSFQLFGEIASAFIRENHPLFKVDGPLYQSSGNLSSRSSTDALNNNPDAPRIISKRGRPKKSDSNDALDNMISVNKKRKHDYSDLVLDENSRSKRNVGPPKHFENMIMMEGTGRRKDRRDRGNDDGEDYAEDNEGPVDASKDASKMGPPNKRNRRGKDDNKADTENPQRNTRKPGDSHSSKVSEREGFASTADPTHQGATMYRQNMPVPHGAASSYHNYNPAYHGNHSNHPHHSSAGPQYHPYGNRPVHPPQSQNQVENKKASFEQFLEQLREFFSMIGAWYGVSGPIVLHYLREQILPVLRVLSASPVSKDTANNLIYQISRSISNPLICVLFLKLIAIGRGFPLYSAIVHTVKRYDPENLYGIKSMHFFVEPPPVDVFNIYLRKVVEALNGPAGPEVFRQVAGLMEEIVVEWKNYDITLEKRLEKIAQIDRLLPENMRGLRARLYHVLFMPTTIMSNTLQQQQELDEMHVITNASTMVGEEISRILSRIGLEAMCDTGVVPSGIPNAILFNNVAFVKAAPVQSMHPAMNPVKGLDYDMNGSSNGMKNNMQNGMQNGGTFGSGPSGGMRNGSFPNPLSSNAGINSYNAARLNNTLNGQSFKPAVKGPYPVAPLNRTNTSGMPYAGTFINHNNSASATTPTDGTHTDLTSRFLSDANTKVPTQYKQPFTDAMKKLFRCMKETSTPQEEIDARVMLVQSFVPPAETRFRADIVRLFKRENFVNSAINTAAGPSAGPIAGSISAGHIGAPGGATRAGMVGATGGSVPTLYTQATGASSSFPRYIGPAMGPGRVSSGVNWVNSYPSQPAYPTTVHGGTIAGSASCAPAEGAASGKNVAKPNAHVQNALDDVIDQDNEDDGQPENVEYTHTASDAPKGKSGSSSERAEDSASVHSDSDIDSNADEEEEQEEPEEEESSGEEKGKQKGRGGNGVDFGVGAVNAPADLGTPRAPILDEVGSTSSDDSAQNSAPISSVCLPSIKELEQRALTKTSPVGNPRSGDGSVSNTNSTGFSSGTSVPADPSVTSSTPQLMLLSNLSKVNPTGLVSSGATATGDVNSMPHSALYLQNISTTNIPNVGTIGYHMSNNSGGILHGITSGTDNTVNSANNGQTSQEDVKRKRGRPRKV